MLIGLDVVKVGVEFCIHAISPQDSDEGSRLNAAHNV